LLDDDPRGIEIAEEVKIPLKSVYDGPVRLLHCFRKTPRNEPELLSILFLPASWVPGRRAAKPAEKCPVAKCYCSNVGFLNLIGLAANCLIRSMAAPKSATFMVRAMVVRGPPMANTTGLSGESMTMPECRL
jgi:hypothetical protein